MMFFFVSWIYSFVDVQNQLHMNMPLNIYLESHFHKYAVLLFMTTYLYFREPFL